MVRKSLIKVLILYLGLGLVFAQAPEKVILSSPRVIQPLPFAIGETLLYEVSFSKLIFSGTIGELKISVSKPSNSAKPDRVELEADAVSKGFFPSLFGLKVRNHYSSLVNSRDLGVDTSTKLLEEGKVRREQRSVINREAGLVTYTDRDLANAKSEPRVKERPSPPWVQDLLSVIYFVRTQPLKEGDVVPVPISDGGEVYNIDVVAGKREEIKTGLGKFQAILLNARVFNGRYVRRNGEMLVWVTDDARRIPLHARIKTSGSTVTVDLKRMLNQ
ncbi:MAG: DUF3108 domain-containing protein [Blastocatellia bacterium]